ncbi:MAG: hypothetical protein QNK04_18895 [Myxococcota bacterium]|nr:hypothetical protein [Myxococcota bacterium]
MQEEIYEGEELGLEGEDLEFDLEDDGGEDDPELGGELGDLGGELGDLGGELDDLGGEDGELGFEGAESLEGLAQEALESEEAEDEFLGALAGLAARALPRLAGRVVPQVIKVGRKVLRRRSPTLARLLPTAVRRTLRLVRGQRRLLDPAQLRRILIGQLAACRRAQARAR